MEEKTIPISQLEKYMEVYRVETEIKVQMTNLLEISKLNLQMTATLKNKLEWINNHKRDFKLDKGVMTLLQPYIIQNISIPKLRKALGMKEE